MAKKTDTQEQQIDMFPQKAEIAGLGITEFKIKGSQVSASLDGVINTNDIAQITDDCWKVAIAEWLFKLAQCKTSEVISLIYQVERRMTEAAEEAEEAALMALKRDQEKTNVVGFK